jgi:uncharacterized DUF497 family protein
VTFEWNERKSSHNRRKHGVGFREAATVFDDLLSTTFPDEEPPSPNVDASRLGSRRSADFSSWRIPKLAVQFE